MVQNKLILLPRWNKYDEIKVVIINKKKIKQIKIYLNIFYFTYIIGKLQFLIVNNVELNYMRM